jgi:hypothetical protein
VTAQKSAWLVGVAVWLLPAGFPTSAGAADGCGDRNATVTLADVVA